MWKFILLFLTAIEIKSTFGADLNCLSLGTQCSYFNITNIVSSNDTINIVGKPSTYTDSVTTTFMLNSNINSKYFPTKLLSIFPSLQHFETSYNGLTYLDTNTFDYCQNLISIFLSNENFTNLPKGFAQNCVKLEVFYLVDCKLSTIDPNAFQGLSKLKKISLERNQITCIPPKLFSHTPLIEIVWFFQNQITMIDPILLKGLSRLWYFNIASNKISYIPNLDLTGTGINLAPDANYKFSIILSDNPIIAVYPQFFENTFQTRNTNLSFDVNIYSVLNITKCFPTNTPEVNTTNWSTAKVTYFSTCFSAWTSTMENTPVPCAPITTTSTTPASSNCNLQCNSGPSCCGQKKVLEVILSEFRNMTFNVSFN